MPAFHEVLFPENISYGSAGGPKFKTTIFTADSGYEQRNVDWSATRAEYDISQSIKTQGQMDELTEFFFARKGRAYGFRFKDWNDYQIVQQVIAAGDGSTKTFQIVKSYTSAQSESGESYTYTRNLTKIDWNTIAGVTVGVSLKVAGTDYTVDHNTGLITFVTAPGAAAQIKIGFGQFHVPVRFDTDHLDAAHEFWNTQTWGQIPLVEVRDWSAIVQ
jgi:uncharacterized protein (TIGR02217 family)